MKNRFLRSLLVISAMLTIVSCGSQEKNGWYLSMQSFTFHRFTFEEALDKTRELGIKYIEAFPGHRLGGKLGDKVFGPGLTSEERAEVKAMAESRGIKIISSGVYATADPDEWERIFSFAKDMDMDFISCEPPTNMWRTISGLVEKYGIKVAVHNHPKPSAYWSPDLLLAKIGRLDARIGACADPGHWARCGLDANECLQRLEGRVISLHIKDIAAAREGETEQNDVIWGEGILDVKAMLQTLKDQKFRGMLTIEYENNWDNSVPDIKQCIDYYDRVTAEIF